MRIYQAFSHNGGEDYVRTRHTDQLREVQEAIVRANAVYCLRKKSEEKTKPPLLFSPPALNDQIKSQLHKLGWATVNPGSKKGYREPRITFSGNRFREMDGLKNRVGLECQFGKYAFMGYDILSKMVIFNKHNLIDCGIEIVVVESMIRNMSTGVSAFDQITLDLTERGVSNLDIPVLILGIGLTDAEEKACATKRALYRADPAGMLQRGEVDGRRKGALPGPKRAAEEDDEISTEENQLF